MIRAVEPEHMFGPPPRRRHVVRCTVEGCLRSTREGKPWCSQHVNDWSPLAIGQLVELEARRAEVEAMEPRPEGSLVHDVLNLIQFGHANNGLHISRYLPELERDSARSYVTQLVGLGLVCFSNHKLRGVPVLRLTEKGKKLVKSSASCHDKDC